MRVEHGTFAAAFTALVAGCGGGAGSSTPTEMAQAQLPPTPPANNCFKS